MAEPYRARSLRNTRMRAIRQQESPEDQERRLQRRRAARQQESPEQRELRLQTRRVSERLARQRQSAEQRQLTLETRRESNRLARRQQSVEQRQRSLESRRTSNKTVEKFTADLKATLDYCQICHCLVYTDKAKLVSSTIVTETCPTEFHPQAPKLGVVEQLHTRYKSIKFHGNLKNECILLVGLTWNYPSVTFRLPSLSGLPVHSAMIYYLMIFLLS